MYMQGITREEYAPALGPLKGRVSYAEFFNALKEVGYDGVVSAEVYFSHNPGSAGLRVLA